MSSVLISTNQIDDRPNKHFPMRVAFPPAGNPSQAVAKASMMKTKKKRSKHPNTKKSSKKAGRPKSKK